MSRKTKTKPQPVVYRLNPCARAVRSALVMHYQIYQNGRVPDSVHKAKDYAKAGEALDAHPCKSWSASIDGKIIHKTSAVGATTYR